MSLRSALLVFCATGDKGSAINTLPPLGILGIASFLEHKGLRVDVLDLSVDHRTPLNADQYDLVGFSINISNRERSLKAIAEIKAGSPQTQVVVGGPLCMSNPELFTELGQVDAVFACEGEEALFEYMTTGEKRDLKGVYVKTPTGYDFSGPRPWIEDLDSMPYPAFGKVDMTRYNNFPKRHRPVSSMITSRGCPFGCVFCSHSMGRKWRARSPENVVGEIKLQVNQFGVREICIYDDNFSLNRDRAEKICDLIVQERVKVTLQFSNGLRADSLHPQLLMKLKAAGTWLIGLAPESGNPDILRKIKKGFGHSSVLEARKSCRRAGIKTFGFFMIGFPFEDKYAIDDTIRFAKQLDCELVEFSRVIPYARTELYDMIVRDGDFIGEASEISQSYLRGPIRTHRVKGLSAEEVETLIRRAYRGYYLRPRKMVDLLRTFSLRDLWGITLYALRTRNV